MKTPPIFYLLAGMMALALVGCEEQVLETPTATPAPTPTPVATPSADPVFVDWREGYAAVLGQAVREQAREYFLYDVDGDTQPELFIQYEDSHFLSYSFREGKMVYLKEAAASAELFSGTESIPGYRAYLLGRHPEWQALTLPLYDYGTYPRQTQDPLEEPEVRKTVLAALEEDGGFEGCPCKGPYGATGWVVLSEYLMGAVPYGEGPLTAAAMAWADVNGDGQTDGILWLEGCENRSFYAVFHVQDGTVYAYLLDFVDGLGIDPDGTVFLKQGQSWRQVSFDGEQCYDFPALRQPVEGCDLAWDSFPANP